MDVSLTLWVLTIVGLAALIAVDFFIGRKPHDVSIKEAGIWTVVWIALAGLFGLGLLVFGGGQAGGEFFAGFITEKSLSVDNLFVFVLIMAKFAVPSQYQQRVLLVGVLIALVLRAIFIAAGAAILASFAWVFYIFGAFLIWTAWKLIQEARADEEDEEFEENKLLKAAERRFGVADRYHGTKLWIEENGKRVMTPMLVVMLAIGTTDVLFALDSIPAIFGLTQDPYIVFTANAFALMGLRQLYFLIGGLLRKLVHLSYGLSIILGFIGVKLVLHALHESGRPCPGDQHPGLARRDLLGPDRHHDHQPEGLQEAGGGRGGAGGERRRSEGQHRGLTTSDVGDNHHRERYAANCRPPLPVLRWVLSASRPGSALAGWRHRGRPMKFVQIVDFETDRIDEMQQLSEEMEKQFAGRSGGPTHRIVLQDRNKPGRYLVVIEFDSYEEAMRNSDDPETTKMAEQMAALCTGRRLHQLRRTGHGRVQVTSRAPHRRSAGPVRLCDDRSMIARLRTLTTQWTSLVPVLAVVLLVFTWGRDLPGVVVAW